MGAVMQVVKQEVQENQGVMPFSFEGNEVRAWLDEDGQPWFVASDVAAILDYRDAANMVRNLDDDEADTHNLSIRSDNGTVQSREVTIINESGLYSAIFSSRKEEARKFKKWVTSEVLPSIRKTGSYALGTVAQLEDLTGSVKKLEAQKIDLKEEIAKYDQEACKLFSRVDKFREEYGVRGKDAEAAIIELTDLNEALRDRVAELTEENLSLLFKKDELEHRVQYYQYNNGYGPLTKGQLIEGTNRANSKAMRSAGAHAFKMAKLHLDQLRDMLASFGYPLQHPGVMMVDAALYEMRNFSAWSGPRL